MALDFVLNVFFFLHLYHLSCDGLDIDSLDSLESVSNKYSVFKSVVFFFFILLVQQGRGVLPLLPLPREEPGLIPPVAMEELVRAPWAPASPSGQQSLGACSCWQAAPCQRFLFIMLLLVAPRIARGPMGIPFPWSSEVPLARVALGNTPRAPFWKGEQL